MEARRTLAILVSAVALGCAGEPAPAAPPPATHALEGGGRLLVLERPDLDLLRGSVRFESGTIREPAQRTGLLEVMTDALYYGGPLQLTGAEFHRRLRSHESTVSIRSGAETLAFDFTCPPAALEETLDAVAGLLVAPAYPPEFIDRARERMLDELERESEDPSAVADRLLLDLAYGSDAPHTRRPTFETLEAVTRAALLDWHAENLVRERMWVGVVGPLSEGQVAVRVQSDLAQLPRGTPALAVPQPPFRAPRETRVVAEVLPHADRCELRVAAPGIGFDDADYAALRLWSDAVAGGGSTSGAFFAPRWSGGELLGFASENADVTALLAHLDPRHFPAERLEAARARILAADEAGASEWTDLARALDLARHGLPADFWECHRAQLESLDATAVAAAAERHLPRGGVLVVGVHPERPAPSPFPTEHRQVRRELRGTPQAVEVLETMLERLGGRQRWADLVGLHLTGVVALAGADEDVAVEIWRDFPARRLRLEQTRAGVTSAQVVTPDGAWGVTGEEATRLDDGVHRLALQREQRLVFRVLHELALGRALSVRLSAKRLEVLRGGRLHGWFLVGADGLPTRWVVPRSEHEELFATDLDGWTSFAGYRFPTRMSQSELGRSFTWSEVTPDPELGQALFRFE